MNTEAIKNAATRLENRKSDLSKAHANYRSVKALVSQHGYSITIGDVRIGVAGMDCDSYSAKLIRGREMIHLGALKALQGVIGVREQQVAQAEAELRALIGGNTNG